MPVQISSVGRGFGCGVRLVRTHYSRGIVGCNPPMVLLCRDQRRITGPSNIPSEQLPNAASPSRVQNEPVLLTGKLSCYNGLTGRMPRDVLDDDMSFSSRSPKPKGKKTCLSRPLLM